MITRRQILTTGAALLAGGSVSAALGGVSAATQPPIPAPRGQRYVPVVTLNGSSLQWHAPNALRGVWHSPQWATAVTR